MQLLHISELVKFMILLAKIQDLGYLFQTPPGENKLLEIIMNLRKLRFYFLFCF